MGKVNIEKSLDIFKEHFLVFIFAVIVLMTAGFTHYQIVSDKLIKIKVQESANELKEADLNKRAELLSEKEKDLLAKEELMNSKEKKLNNLKAELDSRAKVEKQRELLTKLQAEYLTKYGHVDFSSPTNCDPDKVKNRRHAKSHLDAILTHAQSNKDEFSYFLSFVDRRRGLVVNFSQECSG